jgi:hypothetical protein
LAEDVERQLRDLLLKTLRGNARRRSQPRGDSQERGQKRDVLVRPELQTRKIPLDRQPTPLVVILRVEFQQLRQVLDQPDKGSPPDGLGSNAVR